MEALKHEELPELDTSRAWAQLSADEKKQQIEQLRRSGYVNILHLLVLQQRLQRII